MSNWQTKELGDIAAITKGQGLSKEQLTADGNNPCIHYGELFLKYREVIREVTSRTNVNAGVVFSKTGDVLMPTSDVTPRGLATASCIQIDRVILGGDILVIRPSVEQLDGRFLAYFVAANKQAVLRLVSGSTIFHLYGSDMKKLKLQLPSKSEQQHIVQIFEVWDRYLESLEHKIKTKKQLKQCLMRMMFYGDISKRWKQASLDSICIINPKTDGLPAQFRYIDLECVEKGKLVKEASVLNRDSAPSRAQRVLRQGDILFQTVRPYQQNNLSFDLDGIYVASTGYAQLRATGSTNFLYYLVHTQHFLKEVLKMCTGSNYPAVNSSDLLTIKVNIPSIEEQEKIGTILQAVDREISSLTERVILVRRQKQYLLKKLISGAISVSEDVQFKESIS